MITDYNRLSGLHKVAILFTVLGESLAMSLIKGLSRTEIRKIRATISEMDSVSFTLKRRIMVKYAKIRTPVKYRRRSSPLYPQLFSELH